MDGMGAWLVIVAVIVVFAMGIRYAQVWKTDTVFEHWVVVRYVNGHIAGVMGPGRYRYNSKTTEHVAIDQRPTIYTVPGQEVLTSDYVSLKVSVSAVCRIVDPTRYVGTSDAVETWVHQAVQVALRKVTSDATIDDLLAKRNELSDMIQRHAALIAQEAGIELQSVAIKDLMFPGDFKRAFAQVAIARQEGVAALERARGETAALRNLANAAKMAEDNPNLMTLRALQAIETSGGTLVLGNPPTPAT